MCTLFWSPTTINTHNLSLFFLFILHSIHHQLSNHFFFFFKMLLQLHLNLLPLTFFIFWSLQGALGDPQILLLNKGCSQYNATDLSNFNQNLNATLNELRVQVSNQSKHFATAQEARGQDPVYALFQCRNYLSTADCAACYDAAAAQIRNCSAGANGARVIYDGCLLRYTFTITSISYA